MWSDLCFDDNQLRSFEIIVFIWVWVSINSKTGINATPTLKGSPKINPIILIVDLWNCSSIESLKINANKKHRSFVRMVLFNSAVLHGFVINWFDAVTIHLVLILYTKKQSDFHQAGTRFCIRRTLSLLSLHYLLEQYNCVKSINRQQNVSF